MHLSPSLPGLVAVGSEQQEGKAGKGIGDGFMLAESQLVLPCTAAALLPDQRFSLYVANV